MWFFSLPNSLFFFTRQCLAAPFSKIEKKISDYRQWSSTQNNSEIASQSVCVTEEDSVCGDRRSYRFGLPRGGYGVYVVTEGATVSGFLGAVTGISADSTIGKAEAPVSPRTMKTLELVFSWLASTYSLWPDTISPSSLVTAWISLTLTTAWGRISHLREEAVTAGAWRGVLPVWVARSFRFIANSKK